MQGLYLPVAIAVAIVVFGLFGFAIVRYRAREGRKAAPTQDHDAREVAIACLIGAVVAVLLAVTLHANQAETRVAPRPGFRVNVVAFRWGWSFTYPSRTFDLTFPEGGTYAGHCAQFCGLKHSDMVFSALALSPTAFRAWAAGARRGR